ncbi:trigger factor [Candidatus Saccharibacteria bacterium]|nr:trigger factor [Candidatus Saccharibacteria bacterium]
MKSEMKKLDGGRVELRVVLDKPEIEAAHKAAVEFLAKDVKVKGYRPGKAPLYAVERQLDPNALIQHTTELMVRSTLLDAMREHKVHFSNQPEVDVVKFVPAETFEYKATADLMPEVKLGDYKNLKAKRPKPEKVSAEEVEAFIKSMAGRNRTWKEVKRVAKSGDRVIMDFLGKESGTPFEGGAGKDFALELGSNMFVPGFEEKVVGHKAGEEFVIDLRFPKDYHAHLANKKVQFEIKLHRVEEGSGVTVDDAFAKTMGFPDLKSFESEVAHNRERVAETEADDRHVDALVQELVKKSKITMPEGVVTRMMQEIEQQSPGAPRELVETQARTRAEMLSVLNELAVAMKIAVTDEELAQQIDVLKIQHKDNAQLVERLNTQFVQDDIRGRMRMDKVVGELRKLYSK